MILISLIGQPWDPARSVPVKQNFLQMVMVYTPGAHQKNA